MKGFTGSATEGSFGVAATEDDARAKRGSLLTGTINWSETNGGKEFKPFVLSQRTKGEKLWVYVTSDQPLTGSQTITVSWPVNGTVTLSSTSANNVAVQAMTVGQ